MKVELSGKIIDLDSTKKIGEGGEAIVYGNGIIAPDQVLKIYKQPDHVDFKNNPAQQLAVKNRLNTYAKKFAAFPKIKNDHFIGPIELAYLKSKVAGYSMKLVENALTFKQFSSANHQNTNLIDPNKNVDILKKIHQAVMDIHHQNMVIGDFNDLNVLIKDHSPYFIDVDSYQFENFPCRTYTIKFSDPMLFDLRGKILDMVKAHNQFSDWYAFMVMLMQVLLYTGPHGGLHKPKDPKDFAGPNVRPFKRLSVFDPSVAYPKNSRSLDILPDPLLDLLDRVFSKDHRENFSIDYLHSLKFVKCNHCETIHAKAKCPKCDTKSPLAVRQTIEIRGKVKATHVFKTSGAILYAKPEHGALKFLFLENKRLYREDRVKILDMDENKNYQFEILKDKTFICHNNRAICISDSTFKSVDRAEGQWSFSANANDIFWILNGELKRDSEYGEKTIGSVLWNQTMFWAGDQVGFGFYRFGQVPMGFTFKPESVCINDEVEMPQIIGKLIDAQCYFSGDCIWFFYTLSSNGIVTNHCHVFNSKGKTIARAEGQENDGTWLESIHGKCPSGKTIFSPSDNGLIRAKIDGDSIVEEIRFPDTEPFIKSNSKIYSSKHGLYVVDEKEILLIQMQ